MLVIIIDQIKTKSKQNRQVSAFYTWAQVHQSTSNSLAVSQQSTFQPSSKTNPCEASNTNLLCLHQSKQHQHATPSSKQLTPTCYTFIKNKSLWGKQHQPATSINSQLPLIKPMSSHCSLSTLNTTQKPTEENGQSNYAHLQLDSGRVWCQCAWRVCMKKWPFRHSGHEKCLSHWSHLNLHKFRCLAPWHFSLLAIVNAQLQPCEKKCSWTPSCSPLNTAVNSQVHSCKYDQLL